MQLKITPEVRECIRRLGAAFRREAVRRTPEFSYHNVNARISAALGISRQTVSKVFNETESVNQVVKKLHKEHVERNVIQRTEKRQKFDDFDMQTIKRTVHQLFAKREYVTLNKLKDTLSKVDLNCSTSSLRRYLKKLGYEYKKSHGKRFLKESAEIIATRHNYLRKIKKYREDGWEIVYLDETWVNSNHACKGEWTHNRDGPTGVILPQCKFCSRHIPSGKGSRLIVLDAGSSNSGFIEGVGLIFTSKTNSEDYHDEMNGRHFLDWFESTLVPALPNPSVIVMDNAPYHNIRTEDSLYPTTKSRKEEIAEWLQEKGIDADMNTLKCELLKLVKMNKPVTKYKTDEIAQANGHLVLRLPVRHCELNPIELIQAEEKYYVAARNTTFKLSDTKELFLEAKASITVEKWQNATRHVIDKVERNFWTYDGVMEEEVPPFIINLTDDDESDSDSDDDNLDNDNDIGPGGDATNVNDTMDVDDDDNDHDNDHDPDSSDSDDDVLCQTCQQRNPDGRQRHIDWLCCDLCDAWYHVSCLKISKSSYKKIIENEIYWCNNCKEKLYNR